MPTYQYVCTECGGQIEAVQKFTDDPLTVHDACGGRLRKVFSPVGIVFKGSGFYRNDSRSGPGSSLSTSSASSDSPASSDSGSSGGEKTSGGDKAPDKPASDKSAKPDKPGPGAKGNKSARANEKVA